MSERSSISLEALLSLAEVGFLAADMGRPDKALAIFSALAVINPHLPHPVMNQAIVRARFGHVQQAIQDLQALLLKFPESQIVKAVLGKCLTEIKDPRAQSLLEEVIKNNSDSEAVAIAKTCHGIADKKRTSPPLHTLTEGLQSLRHYNHHNKNSGERIS